MNIPVTVVEGRWISGGGDVFIGEDEGRRIQFGHRIKTAQQAHIGVCPGHANPAEAFADILQKSPRLVARRTSISGALDIGAAMFGVNNFTGKRRVIDISGDGANNSGDLVDQARDRTVAMGITINGLPILNQREGPSGRPQIAGLDLYYRDCVIGGPGAFHIAAKNFKDFGRAVLRKLVLEIAGTTPETVPNRSHAGSRRWPGISGHPYLISAQSKSKATLKTKPKAPPCYVGEQRWRQRRGYGPDGWMPQYPRQ